MSSPTTVDPDRARTASSESHISLAQQIELRLVHRKKFYLALIAALYFASCCAASKAKLLWYDEFFTWHVSRLPTIGDIWHALAIGTTNDAPLNYILPRAAAAVLGAGPIALRLPAMFGVAVMCVCLFVYVHRRFGLIYGFLALLIPLSTEVMYYAVEGRPYGVMLGCAGIAFLCWTQAAEGHRRALSLAGLSLSLAAAVSTHYVAVLLWVPLAAGEILRIWRRQLDWPVWLAMALGAAPLLLFLPLIRASHQYTAHIWESTSLSAAHGTYGILLAPLSLPLVAALVLASLLPGAERESAVRVRCLPSHEVVAATCLALLPFFGLLLGKLVTGTYVPRYAFASIIGVTVLFVAAISGRVRLAAVLAVVLGGWFWFNSLQSLKGLGADPAGDYRAPGMRLDSGLPVVVSNADLFLKLEEYGPPGLRNRLYFLQDTTAALRFLGNDTGERNMRGLRQITALPIVDYAPFVRAHRHFLVWGPFINRFDWILQQLRSDGAHVEYLRDAGDSYLFDVSMR